ncbi:hypothetical protein HDU93_001325 [Gonapodya sp. JEL0774]|nr:hypothetical protein HDU93_001325 [Gonapodya sp. JEL0774]
MHILPWSAWLYLLNYLDRTNMGSVKIANNDIKADVLTELNLTDSDWQLAISVFFIGYVIFEIPANLMIKRVGPARWMSRIMVSWGICATCLCFCHNLLSVCLCRLFLGISEAGYYPGMMFYFSIWYTQKEFAMRCSVFYCSANLAGAFGGLLAYAISFMNGIGGWAGWRWIFLFEGGPSIIFGVLTWFVLPNYPHTVSWLTEEEKAWAEARVGSSAPSAHAKHFDYDEFIAVLKDPHSYIMSALYLADVLAAYAFTFWLPTIIKNMGYTSATALLLSVPPWIAAWFFSLAVTYNSDRTQERVMHLVAVEGIFLLSLIMFAVIPPGGSNTGALYFACFLACCGSATFIPLVWAWRTGTATGTTGNAVATGLMNSFGNIGGAVSTFMFRSDWATRYIPAFAICAGLSTLCIALVIIEDRWQKAIKARKAAASGDA